MEERVTRLQALVEQGEKRADRFEGKLDRILGALSEVGNKIAAMEARLDHTATREDLAKKPGKSYMWMVLGVLIATAFAAVVLGVNIDQVISRG